MATTVTATASAPKASSVIQLPTPPAGLQYYFSITVQTTRASLVLVMGTVRPTGHCQTLACRKMALPACSVKQAALCRLCSALLCNLSLIHSSAVCSSQAPGPGPAPHRTATTSAWYVLPCCQPACAFFHCAAASSTSVCLVSPSLHSAAPMSALLWAQLSSPAGLWMEPRHLDAPYAHPTPDRRSGGRAKTRGCARRTDMLLAPAVVHEGSPTQTPGPSSSVGPVEDTARAIREALLAEAPVPCSATSRTSISGPQAANLREVARQTSSYHGLPQGVPHCSSGSPC